MVREHQGEGVMDKEKFEYLTFLSISAISSSKSIMDATRRSLAASFHKPNIARAIPLTLYPFAESGLTFNEMMQVSLDLGLKNTVTNINEPKISF